MSKENILNQMHINGANLRELGSSHTNNFTEPPHDSYLTKPQY